MEKLPTEIASNVAGYVPRDSLVTCMEVCRAWYYVFFRKFYENVVIKSRRQFKLFIACIQHAAVNGTLIRTLNMKSGLSQVELEMLVSLLPGLRELHLSIDTWRHLKFTDKLTKWKNLTSAPTFCSVKMFSQFYQAMGHQLTHLELEPPVSEDLQFRDDRIFGIILGMPRLEHFGLRYRTPYNSDLNDLVPIEDGRNEPLYMTPDWLASLYRAAPQLKSLKLGYVSLRPVSAPAIAPGTTAPLEFEFGQLKYLDLEGSLGDLAWVEHYIPHIFKNVVDLKARFELDLDLPDLEHRIADASLQLFTKLTHLQHVWYFCGSRLEERQLGTIIPRLVALGRCYQHIELGETPFKSLTPLLNPKTTTTLYVTAWEPLDKTFESLQHFKCLTELALDLNNLVYTLHIDSLLNSMCHLETFSLMRASSIDCTYCYLLGQNTHPLSRLEIVGTGLKARAVSYISHQCLNLKKLMLVEVYMEADQDGHTATLDFSSQTFKVITIDQIYLSDTGEYVPEDEFEEQNGVQLIAVSQIKRIEKKITRLQSKGKSIAAVVNERIYFAEDDYNQSLMYQKLARLSALRLHSLHSMSAARVWERENASNWQKSLQHGFIRLVCQDVRNLAFNYAPQMVYY